MNKDKLLKEYKQRISLACTVQICIILAAYELQPNITVRHTLNLTSNGNMFQWKGLVLSLRRSTFNFRQKYKFSYPSDAGSHHSSCLTGTTGHSTSLRNGRRVHLIYHPSPLSRLTMHGV